MVLVVFDSMVNDYNDFSIFTKKVSEVARKVCAMLAVLTCVGKLVLYDSELLHAFYYILFARWIR